MLKIRHYAKPQNVSGKLTTNYIMTEIIDIYEGKGKIKIKGNITDSYFYINGNPKIVSFFAEVGTVWRYLIGTTITDKIIDDNYQYESLVSSGKLNFDVSLQNQFGHILNSLSNGQYELKFCEFPFDINYLELNDEGKPFPHGKTQQTI